MVDLNSRRSPTAHISAPTARIVKPEPEVSGQSGRGPGYRNAQLLKVVHKHPRSIVRFLIVDCLIRHAAEGVSFVFLPFPFQPDILAPGISILAAYSPATVIESYIPNESRRLPYFMLSGTSMAAPHVAGVVALLKAMYPHWSPAALKSAIMTTGEILFSSLHADSCLMAGVGDRLKPWAKADKTRRTPAQAQELHPGSLDCCGIFQIRHVIPQFILIRNAESQVVAYVPSAAATTQDNTGGPIQDAVTNKDATPFDLGSGFVQPNAAMDPGLVYDVTNDDYLRFLCVSGLESFEVQKFADDKFRCPEDPVKIEDLNLPSIGVADLKAPINVTRTLKNVGAPGTYHAHVQPPEGVTVSVEPATLDFKAEGEEKTFQVTLAPEGGKPPAKLVHGQLTWSDGRHTVRSPITVAITLR